MQNRPMAWWVPALIFVLVFSAAVVATARWLPELAPGPVGGITFFAVCGLAGAAAGLAGLHIYEIVRNLEEIGGGAPFARRGDVLAEGLVSMLYECALIGGAAVAVFLLGPPGPDPEDEPPSGA